jgi:uncharacterized membrane protein
MVFYPLIVHLLIALEAPWLAVIGLVATSFGYLLLVIGFQRDTGAHPGWIGLYLGINLLGIVNLLTDTHYVLFVPPVAINLAIAAAFAVTLRPATSPLVERLMRFEFGGDLPPPPLRAYARVLTVTWAVYFAAVALISLGLAVAAPLETWSLFTNVLHYVLAFALLAAQFLYRAWRYRCYGLVMPWDTLRAMARRPWPVHTAAPSAAAPGTK